MTSVLIRPLHIVHVYDKWHINQYPLAQQLIITVTILWYIFVLRDEKSTAFLEPLLYKTSNNLFRACNFADIYLC